MPHRAPRACLTPGCPNTTTTGGYCTIHRHRRERAYNQAREHDNGFYRTPRWRRFRAWFLAENPLCVMCLKDGRVTAAKHVDHVVERKKAPERELDLTNCQPLCHSCHSKKTRREQAGGRGDDFYTARV